LIVSKGDNSSLAQKPLSNPKFDPKTTPHQNAKHRGKTLTAKAENTSQVAANWQCCPKQHQQKKKKKHSEMEEKSHRSDCNLLRCQIGSVRLVRVLHQLLPRNYGRLARPELHREHLPVAFLHERRRRPLLLRHGNPIHRRYRDSRIRARERIIRQRTRESRGIQKLIAEN